MEGVPGPNHLATILQPLKVCFCQISIKCTGIPNELQLNVTLDEVSLSRQPSATAVMGGSMWESVEARRSRPEAL